MDPPLTIRRPSRNRPSEHVFAQKETSKRGLKRRASREAVNPHGALKRARGDSPRVLFLERSSQKSQAVSVGNPREFSGSDTPLTLFVWGCGDDGSFGLGPDHLGEIPRPQRLHGTWVTSIAAGGLYTLLLDRDGKVGAPYLVLHSLTNSVFYVQVWSCGNNDNYALGRETGFAKHGWSAPHGSFDELVSKPHVIPGLEYMRRK